MAVSAIAYEGSSFEKFLKWTDEKEVLGSKIRDLVKPSYESLLDVGAGTGDLTEYYMNLFRKIVLVEPAITNAKLLSTRFANAQLVQAQVEEFRPPDMLFDMVVASHMLIYVKNPLETIDRLFSLLRPEGRLVIVMLDRECEYLKFVDEFYQRVLGDPEPRLGREAHWEIIVEHCSDQEMHMDVTDEISILRVPSVDEFLSMNDFHFNSDVRYLDNTVLEDMRRYLNHLIRNGSLSLNIKHKLIVLER